MEDDNKRSKVPAIIVGILLLAAIAATGYFGYQFILQNQAEQQEWASTYDDRATPTVTPSPSKTEETSAASTSEESQEIEEPAAEPTTVVTDPLPSVAGEYLASQAGYMIRVADDGVVMNKDGDRIIFPASMTKVMTALIVLENAQDLNAKVTVYPEDIDPNYTAGATLAGFEPYEEVTLQDLVYGLMLPSGAEACDAAVTAVCQTKEEFIELMNQKAIALGMSNTHFSNTTGLHADDHFSTCHDMAILMKYAITNDTFRTIAGTATYTCTPTTQHPEGLTFSNTLFAQLQTPMMTNGAVIEGGKTGTTDQAGRCLASFGRLGLYEYVLVTALAPTDAYYNVSDAVSCYSSL